MFINPGVTARSRDLTQLRHLCTPGKAALALTALLALIVALWPLGLTSDYLNHLARNAIESRIWFDTDLQRFYGVSLAIIPDLTMDLIVPWLAHLTGIYTAGAMTVWMAFVLPPLAGLMIAQSAHGRITWGALAGFLLIFNENMQWGFVNFTASSGLALLGFAVWMRVQSTWRTTLLFAAFSTFLAFNHALAFLLFGYLVLLWEVACFARGERGSLPAFLGRLASKGAVAMVPGLAVIALATGQAQELADVGVTDFNFVVKLSALWSGALFFNQTLSHLVIIALIVAFWAGYRRGIVTLDPRLAWVCAGLLVLVIFIPTTILGIWGLHYRYPAALFILVAASIRFQADGPAGLVKPVSFAAAALLFAVYVNGAFQMSKIDAQARDLRSVLASLPSGARLLPARHEDADLSFALHSAAMAVIERSAYVPNLFTNTSPVDVLPDMRALHMPQSWPVLEEDLAMSKDKSLPEATNGHWSGQYYYGWPDHWDYVLFFRAEPTQTLELSRLCPVAEAEGVVLYRVANGCPQAKG